MFLLLVNIKSYNCLPVVGVDASYQYLAVVNTFFFPPTQEDKRFIDQMVGDFY